MRSMSLATGMGQIRTFLGRITLRQTDRVSEALPNGLKMVESKQTGGTTVCSYELSMNLELSTVFLTWAFKNTDMLEGRAIMRITVVGRPEVLSPRMADHILKHSRDP